LPVILISEEEEKTRIPLNYSTVDGLYIRGEMVRNATMKFIKNLISDENTVNLDLIYQAILDNLTMMEGNDKVNTFDGVILAYDIIDITPTITENELIDSLNQIGFIEKINNPPAVAIINPIASEIISEKYSTNGTATDPDGDGTIDEVQIMIDNGTWIIVTGTNSWTFTWDTTSVSDGPHTICARAFDGKNYSIIPEPSVAITVTNNCPPPPPLLDSPANCDVDVDKNPTLKCLPVVDSDGDALKYYFIIGTDLDLTTPLSEGWGGDFGDYNYTLEVTLSSMTQYYWKVRAWDGSDYSEWSPTWSFTTMY
jgi:hypothetical protein